MAEEQEARPQDEDTRSGGALSDSELASLYAIPAPIANRIVATNFSNGMRLSFGEVGMGRNEPDYRAAIFLSYDDAAALSELIVRQLEQLRGGVSAPEADHGPRDK